LKLVPLDLQYFAGEKTEKATPKKKSDARKKGQVAKSQDVSVAIGLLAIFFFFSISFTYLIKNIVSIMKHSFQVYMMEDLTEENVHMIFMELVQEVAMLLGPIMIVALVSGVAANYFQIGFLFSTESIQFKLDSFF